MIRYTISITGTPIVRLVYASDAEARDSVAARIAQAADGKAFSVTEKRVRKGWAR